MKRTLGWLLLLVVSAACARDGKPGSGSGSGSGTATSGPDPKAGHALLDEYVGAFQQLARSGAGIAELTRSLESQAATGRRLHEEKKLDDLFHTRHQRLVRVSLLAVTAGPDGSGGDTTEIGAFLRESGADENWRPEYGLAMLAPALADEVLSLRMHLDGTTDREAARRKYEPQM